MAASPDAPVHAPAPAHRALVLREGAAMVLEERPARLPGPGEVTLAIAATGICGSDLHGVAGHTGRRELGQVMGHETAGRITAVGEGVDPGWLGRPATVVPVYGCGACTACRTGEQQQCPDVWVLGVRVDVDASFAEAMTVPAINLVALPDDFPLRLGALIEPLAVGAHAARRGAVGPDDGVLVIGAGPIGQAAAIAARRREARDVVVSEPDSRRRAMVADLGFRAVAPDELATALLEPPSVVIDAVGASATLATALTVSAPAARVVLTGMASPVLELSAYAVSAGERTIIGTFCYSHDDFRDATAWAVGHPEVLEALVDRFEPLSDGQRVFAELLGDRAGDKVLLVADRDV